MLWVLGDISVLVSASFSCFLFISITLESSIEFKLNFVSGWKKENCLLEASCCVSGCGYYSVYWCQRVGSRNMNNFISCSHWPPVPVQQTDFKVTPNKVYYWKIVKSKHLHQISDYKMYVQKHLLCSSEKMFFQKGRNRIHK